MFMTVVLKYCTTTGHTDNSIGLYWYNDDNKVLCLYDGNINWFENNGAEIIIIILILARDLYIFVDMYMYTYVLYITQ